MWAVKSTENLQRTFYNQTLSLWSHDYLPNTHDQVYHGDGVQVDAPERHEPQHSHLYGDDREGDPEGADRVGDEDEGDDHHDPGGDGDTLDGSGEDNQKLKCRP